MKDKTFVVTHAKAREPLTIEGKTLEKALRKEGLNPDIWKEVQPTEEPESDDHGEAD